MDEFIERLRVWFDQALARLRGGAPGAEDDDPDSDIGDRDIDDQAAIIAVGRDDDVASVVGRMDTADAAEVILVVRGEARALRRPTAWPHISAHARRRGIALAVVSARRHVRTFARQNGLRASSSVKSLQPAQYAVRVGDRDIVIPPVPWGRIVSGGMILAVVAAALIVGCYQVPSADVTIVPRAEPFEVSRQAQPNAIVEVSDVEDGVILANTVRRQIHTAVTTSTTGETEIGDARATLELQFTNDAPSAFQVPGGTRVEDADGVGFTTTGSVDVPAGESAVIGANAEFPGVAGNVAAGTVTDLPGDLPPTLSVTNTTAGAGGTNKLTAAVSQADVDRVHAIAGDILKRIAVNSLRDEVEEGTLIETSVSVAIFSEQPAQLLEEPSDILIIDYVITASALVITTDVANEYGAALIRDELPEGTALIPGSVDVEITVPEVRGAPVDLKVTGQVAELEEIEQVAGELTGKSLSAARSYLSENLDLQEPPQVEVSPNFIPWLWLPRRADHIEVIIAGPGSEEDEDAEATATATAIGTIEPEDPDAQATETASP